MSSSVGFLDFFILEAGEYVEQLDGLFAHAGASGPDGEAVQRAARSLRGSATMAKLPAFAELALSLERLGRARRDGAIQWDARVRGAAVSAVDELKILLRSVRTWGADETSRATARTAELTSLLPAAREGSTPATPASGSGLGFLAGELANIAAGLELLLTRHDDAGSVTMVLRRVRALRGVAAVKDLPPLVAQALEASEQAAAPLEEGRKAIATPQRELLHTSSRLLRGVADALRGGSTVHVDDTDARHFGDALDAWLDSSGDGDRIVPIASLFHDDAGPHVVSTSTSPPTSASTRFRLELVSQGEHLKRLADEARAAHDDAARERYRRELRRALRAVHALAESFEERAVVSLSSGFMSASAFDDATLDRLSRMASLLAEPSLDRETLDQRLEELSAARADVATPAVAAATETETAATSEPAAEIRTDDRADIVTPSAPSPTVAPSETTMAEPAPREHVPASSLLEQGLAGLSRLDTQPLGAPVAMAEQPPVVPIETLLYRGRSAVRRAIELREEMRRGGGSPTREVVEELFDLMELALLDEAVA